MKLRRAYPKFSALIFTLILSSLILSACGAARNQEQVQPAGTSGINITGGIQLLPTGQHAAQPVPESGGGPNLETAAILLLVAVGLLGLIILLFGRGSYRNPPP